MNQSLVNFINHKIMAQAKSLRYTVKDLAPSTESELFNSTSLVVWSGGSDNTIFRDPSVNYAFRALHDKLHLSTGYNFTPQAEIALGRLQASKYDGVMADLVYCEVALQAEYYLKNGVFVPNQVEFTLNAMKGI